MSGDDAAAAGFDDTAVGFQIMTMRGVGGLIHRLARALALAARAGMIRHRLFLRPQDAAEMSEFVKTGV
jgi:hypothetical protein